MYYILANLQVYDNIVPSQFDISLTESTSTVLKRILRTCPFNCGWATIDSKASQLLSSVYSESVENRSLVAKADSMWFVSLRALMVFVSERDVMIASSSAGKLNDAMFLVAVYYQRRACQSSYKTSIPTN